MDYTPKLTGAAVLNEAVERLDDHLPLTAHGYVCSNQDLWRILLGAATKKTTISGYCESVTDGPSSMIVRRYVNGYFVVEDLVAIETALNAALAETIPRRVFRRARETAVDYHEQAYYGKSTQSDGLWIRAEAKDGTTRFYRVATAYVIWKQVRVTLAIKFVLPDDDMVSVLSDLLKRLKALKYRVKTLYLDRGFGSIRVMRFLSKIRLRSVIACTIRGKSGGTRALCKGRSSYVTRYTFGNAKTAQFTARLAVCRTFSTARRTGRHPRKATWMIFCTIACRFSPAQVRAAYRRRFGIESSYRCARKTRGWTTSPNPVLRFVFIALSFFLVNLWVALRWRVAQIPRRGGRVVVEAYFRLQMLIAWLANAIDRIYHPVRCIVPLAQPIE
jgi:putative transposase